MAQENDPMIYTHRQIISGETMSLPGIRRFVQLERWPFYPKEIRDYKASIIVELNDKISWTYPIKVVTESRSLNIDFNFITSCRKKLEKEIELFLPGLIDVNPKETYHAEINP